MFARSKPVYVAGKEKEKNFFSLWPIDFSASGKMKLLLAGANEFSVYLDGKLIDYGPAKAAHGYHRVDELEFVAKEGNHRLLIILAGYNVYSFDRINEPPFIQYKLEKEGTCIAFSSKDSLCLPYKGHIEKVSRFSYQRSFSESYGEDYSNEMFEFGKGLDVVLPLIEVEEKRFLPRRVSFGTFQEEAFQPVEKSPIRIDPSKPIYQDRYMTDEFIGKYPKEEWEVDPNHVVSLLAIEEQSLSLDECIEANQSLAYRLPSSLTGFFHTRIEVSSDCEIYLHFDEINEGKNGHIDFRFYRNTTHNIVFYRLKKGFYELTSFIPYTAQFARISCTKGALRVSDFGLIRLENPDVKMTYQFEDARIQKIFDAAKATFVQNAYDILTDCPSRERAGWLCDSYFTGQTEFLLTGDNKVEKNFLENYAFCHSRDVEEGMVPMCYPADFPTHQYIPNWAMFYGLELLAYWKRTSDEKTKDISISNIEGLVAFFHRFENEVGLLENLENWVFVEWSHANDEESLHGVNLPSNMLYASFLEATGELLSRDELRLKSQSIRKTIRDLGFNGTYFVDNLIRDEKNHLVQNNRICETTQYYAFAFKTATKDTYPDLFRLMKEEFGPKRDCKKVHPDIFPSNVFIGDYLRLSVLLEEGFVEEVLDEAVDYFYNMALLTGTLWEHDSPHASLNHGFASYVSVLLTKAITGFVSIDKQKKTVTMEERKYGHDYCLSIPVDGDQLILQKQEGNLQIILPKGYVILSSKKEKRK